MGALEVPQIHVKRAQNSGFLYVKGRGKWEEQEEIDNCIHLGGNRDPKKSMKSLNLFVSGL